MEQVNSQAELKPFKVGETLTDNADGNPEPSSLEEISKQACVETRRRVCIKCKGEIPKHKYSNAKYCSDRCRNAFVAYNHAVKTGRIKRPGVGSGGAQEGIANHQYKTGIGTYSSKAFEHYGKVCNRCESVENLLVHHRDEDRTNNALNNLEVLCKSCHQVHHCVRDSAGKFTQRDSPQQLETTE